MSTKVKGEKIKEGSIPFEALNIELQNNITSATEVGELWEKGEGEHSAVLKGEITVLGVTYKNEALNEGCVSLGANSKAGLKGYYFTYIDFDTNQIWLHNEQFTSRTLGSLGGWKKNSVSDVNRCGWTIGDVISFTCDGHYDNSATITNVVDNIITVDTLPFTLKDVPSTIISIEAANNKFDECSVFCVKKYNIGTVDLGGSAFAIGTNTQASNAVAHAEGYNTVAYGKYSHTEGNETEAGYNAHAEGYKTKALGERSHAEGMENIAEGNCSHTEGRETSAVGNFSHAEGYKTIANGGASHAEGSSTEAGENAHSEGLRTKALGENSHAEGMKNIAEGNCSHTEGQETQAIGTASHAEGVKTIASEWASHVEGYNCETGGNAEVNDKEIDEDNIEGQMAHAEGNSTIARGNASHAEGTKTIAVGKCSHAQNYKTQAIGIESHAEGSNTIAEGATSHAEGYLTKTIGENSHAEGEGTIADGQDSHAEGWGTITTNVAEHAEGKYNKSTKNITQHSVGIGTADGRQNAHEITIDGKHYILNVGNYDGTNPTDATTLDLANAVVQTTEQTLSDEQKVQVKENIGIVDPVTPNWNAQEGEAGYIENKPYTNRTLVWEKSFTQEEMNTCALVGVVELMSTNEGSIGPVYKNPNLFIEISISETVDGKNHTLYYNDYFGTGRNPMIGSSGNLMVFDFYSEIGSILIGLDGFATEGYVGTLNYFTVKYYLDDVILDRTLTAEDEALVIQSRLQLYDASNDPSFLDGEFAYYVDYVSPEHPSTNFTANGKFKVKGYNAWGETGALDSIFSLGYTGLACRVNQKGISLYHKDPANPGISPEGHIRLIICKSKKLDSHYISDGVIKTSEQTLSNDAKNQALANLGIDPVVWKYMCNPYVVTPDECDLPEEVTNAIEDEYGGLTNLALKLLVLEYDGKTYAFTAVSPGSLTSEFGTLLYENGNLYPEP